MIALAAETALGVDQAALRRTVAGVGWVGWTDNREAELAGGIGELAVQPRVAGAGSENAAKQAEQLLSLAGRELAPKLLDAYASVIWEDQDECLEVRPEDVAV